MLAAADVQDGPDLARMRRDRYARVQAQLAAHDLDGLLLIGGSNVEYATGARVLNADAGRAAMFRTVACVVRDDPFPHVFAAYPDGLPPELPADHIHPAVYPELGIRPVGEMIGRERAIGIDEDTAV